MQHFSKLRVWRQAHEWVLSIYRLTRRFPAEERYGLTAQLRRAATSVPGNLAEGSRRRTVPDYGKFVNIAEGSLAECEYFLMLACDLGYADTTQHLSTAREIAKMLYGLRDALSSSQRGSQA